MNDIENINLSEIQNADLFERASKVCNALNYNFMEALNTKVDDHADITIEIMLELTIKHLLPRCNKDEILKFTNTREFIKSILSNLGIDVVSNHQAVNNGFVLLYDENSSKIQLSLCSEEILDSSVFSTALADLFTLFTNGENEKLYSAYVPKNNVEQKDTIETSKNYIRIIKDFDLVILFLINKIVEEKKPDTIRSEDVEEINKDYAPVNNINMKYTVKQASAF